MRYGSNLHGCKIMCGDKRSEQSFLWRDETDRDMSRSDFSSYCPALVEVYLSNEMNHFMSVPSAMQRCDPSHMLTVFVNTRPYCVVTVLSQG